MSLLNLVKQEIKKRKQAQATYYKFNARPYQKRLIQSFDEGVKFFLICWARRLGKDLLTLSLACRECINKPNTVVYYIFPTMKQGKMMILDGYTNERKRLIDEVIDTKCLKLPLKSDKFYHSDNTLQFKNGSKIYFVGSQDANTKVGGNLDLLVVSEMALIQNDDIVTYLIPSVINVNGRIILVSTPRFGSKFNEMLEKTGDEWEKSIIAANSEEAVDEDGNAVYTEEKLAEARTLMSDSKFRQEYLCDTDVANEEAIYAYSLSRAEWVDSLDISGKKLYVSEDLGINDSTALCFVINNTVIHHYANVDKPTIHYIQYIKEFCVRNKITDIEIILPHDAKNRHDAIDYLTSRKIAYSQHFQNVVVLSAYEVHKTIEITKHSIERHKIKFLDCENVRDMVWLMKKYEWKKDGKTGENLRKPVHGRGLAASNTCDSVEYYCMYAFLDEYDEAMNSFIYSGDWGTYI